MNLLRNPWRGRGLPPGALDDVPFPGIDAARPLAMLRRCPRAGETPLVDAPALAKRLGVARLWLKDERERMGLGSFKALGAAYVIACEQTERRDPGAVYVTASAGNHGLSVAAGAAAFGARAVVYIAETVPESFAARLAREGAEVVRAGRDYAESMEAAAQAAGRDGAILLSDSSWDGYLARPHRLMEGYLVLMAEIAGALDRSPSHVFLQAGVGGLAAAAVALGRERWGDGPIMVVVEPEAAPALFASIAAGTPVDTRGPDSAMGRLDCKTPSLIALKGLARDADLFVTLTEAEGEAGAALLAKTGFPTTPSGGAGVAALAAAGPVRAALGLGPDASVLAILTETGER